MAKTEGWSRWRSWKQGLSYKSPRMRFSEWGSRAPSLHAPLRHLEWNWELGWVAVQILLGTDLSPASCWHSVSPLFLSCKALFFSLPYGKHLSNSRVQLWRGRSAYNRTHQPLPGEGSPAGFVYKSLSTSAVVCAQGEWVCVCRGCGLHLTGMCCYLHSFGQDWLTTHYKPGASRSFQENSRTRFTPISRLTFSKKWEIQYIRKQVGSF